MSEYDPTTWAEIRRIFRIACETDQSRRSEVLTYECADRPDLREAVERLLSQDAQPQVFDADPALSIGLNRPSMIEYSAIPMPERIGPYLIERQIGEGSSGVVYLARQKNPHRRVALKVLHPGVVSRSTMRRFAREPEVTARLADHSFIAKVYSAGIDEQTARPYFAMQYVEGMDIVRFAAKQGLGVAQKIELLLQACDVVQFAHGREVIHRDLKPGNLVVDAAGHVWVLDFGVARVLSSDVPRATLSTDAGNLLGTLEYMSPEQASPSGKTPVTTASDVYALGAVLYELLTGVPPVPCRNLPLLQAVVAITTKQPAPLSGEATEGNRNLVAVLSKALQKSPNDRYKSVSEFAVDLRNALAGRAVSAHKETPSDAVVRFVRHHRARVALSLAILALVTGLLVWGIVARLERARADADMAAALPLVLGEMFARASMTQQSEPLRREVIGAVSGSVRRWAQREPTNPGALLTLARLLGAEAGIEPLAAEANLARREKVAQAFRAAYAAVPELKVAREYAVSMVIVGDVHKELGQLEPASRWYLDAHAIVEQWATRAPTHEGIASDLVWDYLRLADNATQRRSREETERWLGRLAKTAERRFEMNPDAPGAIFDRISAISGALDVRIKLDGVYPTIEDHRELVRLGERLMDRAPYNSIYARAHIDRVAGLARELSRQGYLAEAQASARRAAPFVERWTASDPSNLNIAESTVPFSSAQASIESSAGDTVEAYATLDRVRPLVESWLASDPNKPEILAAASSFYAVEAGIPFGQRCDLAYQGLVDRTKNAEQTFAAIEKAVEYSQRAATLSPNDDFLVDWARKYPNIVVYADDAGRHQLRTSRLPPLLGRLEAAVLRPILHPYLADNFASIIATPSVVAPDDIERTLEIAAKLGQMYPHSHPHAIARVLLLAACGREHDARAELDRHLSAGTLSSEENARYESLIGRFVEIR